MAGKKREEKFPLFPFLRRKKHSDKGKQAYRKKNCKIIHERVGKENGNDKQERVLFLHEQRKECAFFHGLPRLSLKLSGPHCGLKLHEIDPFIS